MYIINALMAKQKSWKIIVIIIMKATHIMGKYREMLKFVSKVIASCSWE